MKLGTGRGEVSDHEVPSDSVAMTPLYESVSFRVSKHNTFV